MGEGGEPMPKIILEMTEEQKNTIDLICRRKRINLVDYLIDNMVEWDAQLYCMASGQGPSTEVCDGCDYRDGCPDFKE